MPTLRALLLIEATSLLVAAALHAGLVIVGPFDQAATYESLIAVILLIGLGLTFIGPTAARVAGLVGQVIALAGASLGLYLVLRGVAPNTVLDIAYHVALIALLVAGLAVAWRLNTSSPDRPPHDPAAPGLN